MTMSTLVCVVPLLSTTMLSKMNMTAVYVHFGYRIHVFAVGRLVATIFIFTYHAAQLCSQH